MTGSAPQSPESHRLPTDVRPERVTLAVEVDPAKDRAFRGDVAIELVLDRAKRSIRLHAANIRVSRPRIECADGVLRGRVVKRPDVEMVEIEFDELIPKGPATLRLGFGGTLRRDLCGLYGAESEGRPYAFTQLEATEARKFFPCFDEPSMKACFRLSVTTGLTQTVISNSPIERVERLGAGRKTVHFEPTPPLSTYLLALAVGELESSEPVHVGPTEIRVWHVPGKNGLTAFGLEAARECLARLETYFDLPYPYEKLDLVAVPDFEFGAMENAGAVFFRETLLLLDPVTATIQEEKRAAEVICHELAHMWYGDLVTMAWWDDLWLNESFATWMAFHVVDDWKPEWKMWHDFQHGRAAALELDALRNTHPIYCEVRTPAEASENFDLITYEKGAAVVRMLERYLGAEPFRAGVRAYIRRHREENAVAADLWRALSEASGEKVEAVTAAWIEQEGYPVVEFRRARRKGNSALLLRQERFVEQPARPGRSRRPGTTWPVPVVARVLPSEGAPGREIRHLLERVQQEIEVGPETLGAIYGNADEGGFFRPLHPPEDFREIVDNLFALSAVERMGLVDHQWALVRANRAEAGSLVDLAAALSGEEDADVLGALRKPLVYFANNLLPDAAPESLAAFRLVIRRIFEDRALALGFDPEPGEDGPARLRRAMLIGLAGGIGESELIQIEAGARCLKYLSNRRSIDPNLADGVVSLAAKVGDGALHDRFVAAMENSATPQEQRRFLMALADFRAPDLVARTLELSLSDRVATQDVVFLLVRLLHNPDARELTWKFVKRRWSAVRKRVPSLGASRLIDATPNLLTPAHRDDVAAFFAKHPVPSGERALRQALERFDWYREFRERAASALSARVGT